MKLENHVKNKTGPKLFQYSARANIPPDETFLKEIKEQAEQSIVRARSRYHRKTFEKQENKHKKAKLYTKTSATVSTDVNRSKRDQLHSANAKNIVHPGCKANNRRKQRRTILAIKRISTKRQNNEKFIKDFSNLQLTDNQVSVISKGLKFAPTPVTNINNLY